MTFDELKERKLEMERQIFDAILQFKLDTGVCVESVQVDIAVLQSIRGDVDTFVQQVRSTVLL